MGTRRAVVYRRVSTRAQADERKTSLEEQLDARRYGEHNLSLVTFGEPFVDVARGKKDDRANYQRMLADVRRGGADVVIVQWLDRFGRNAREILRRVWELQELNVQVVATDEDVKEELMPLVKAGIAGQETSPNGRKDAGQVRGSREKRYSFRPRALRLQALRKDRPGRPEAATPDRVVRAEADRSRRRTGHGAHVHPRQPRLQGDRLQAGRAGLQAARSRRLEQSDRARHPGQSGAGWHRRIPRYLGRADRGQRAGSIRRSSAARNGRRSRRVIRSAPSTRAGAPRPASSC